MQQGYGSNDIGELEGDFPALELPEPHVLHMGAFRHAPRSLETFPHQPALIRSINFSDDGLHCLSASGDGKVRIYDVGSVMLRDQLNIGCAKTAFSHSSAIAITTPYHVSDASVGFLDVEEGVYISQIPICGSEALLGNKRDRTTTSDVGGGGGIWSGMAAQMSSDSQDTTTTTTSGGSLSPLISTTGAMIKSTPHQALLGGGMMGPMCTSISVSPQNDVACVGCKTGEVFLVDPSIGTPLVSIHTSNVEPVVGTCFSLCGQFVVIATPFSVEVHKLSNMLDSSSLTNNKQSTARVVYTMSPCHRTSSSACAGYTSVDCGSDPQNTFACTMIMVGCGCGEGELLNFHLHRTTISKVGGFAMATPSKCFSVGMSVPTGGTGLPFRVPSDSGDSNVSKDGIVGVWRAPSCGALFTTPSNTNTSLVIQGTHSNTNNNTRVANTNDKKKNNKGDGGGGNGGQDTREGEEWCTGVVIRDPLIPTIPYALGGGDTTISRNTINRDQFSAARAFLSCEHDSGGAPRVLAVNPRFGIIAGAHRVLNWWALDYNSTKN